MPAWRQLSVLTGLRRLHVSTGVGWEGAGFAAVAAAATALRVLHVTDNADTGACVIGGGHGGGGWVGGLCVRGGAYHWHCKVYLSRCACSKL